MARPQRNNVDYFPHPVNHGKKMFYLRSKYKNDGYTVWFMLLEELGKAEYHYLDLKDDVQKMYLSSTFMVTEEILENIINDLVKFEEFDKELWENESILYNQKFVNNIKDAYKKRSNDCIDKKSLIDVLKAKGRSIEAKLPPNEAKEILEVPVKPQRILKDIKGKERKGKERKEKEGETSSLHTILKNVFFLWYEHLKKTKYDWSAKDGKNLNLLIPKIKRKMTEAEIEPTDENIQKNFQVFLKGINEKWILDNFTIPII